MQELFIFFAAIFTLLTLSFCVSYKFQKDFTSMTKPAGILVLTLTSMIILLITVFLMTIVDVFNFYQQNMTNDKENRDHNTYKLTSILTLINLFSYIILPFVMFYLLEEKYTDVISGNNNDAESDVLLGEKNYFDINKMDKRNIMNRNISHNLIHESPLNLNLFKNYFYYICALACTNLIYLIIFKMNYFSNDNNLVKYSTLSYSLIKASDLYSDYEILTYANFGMLILLGKIAFLIYLPYGAGKTISSLVENVRGGENMKKEYRCLDNNFSKNYETIKHITSLKLMTGRPLSKKEKMILRSCKETETILQHKQEILEDKFSTFHAFLFYFALPFKFVLIFVCLMFGLLFCFSKGLSLYYQLQTNVYEKFNILNLNTGITIERLLLLLNLDWQVIIISLISIYFTSTIIVSIKNLGIVNILPNFRSFSTSEIRSDKILSLTIYSIFFILMLVSILEIFSILPDISFYKHPLSIGLKDFYDKTPDNTFSLFGIFYLKFYINFPVFKYFDLFFSCCLIILLAVLVIYLPLKSMLNYWDNKEHQQEFIKGYTNDKEETEILNEA